MDLNYVFYIAAPPEEIWKLFINPEDTRKIMYGCRIRSTFEPGESIEFVGPGSDGDHTVHIYGQVLDYEPNRLLSYIEHPGASYHLNHSELTSRITFRLETVGACTKLSLTNDQWTSHHPSHDEAVRSWPMILISNIKTWAETKRTLDFGL
jgi:uncharacterized protein YndB with AHSA1/START domain